MKERPIIFSDPMIRALLAGRKTQTRRVIVTRKVPWLIDPETFYRTPMDDRNGFAEPAVTHWQGAEWYWYEKEYHDEGGHVLFQCPYGQKGDRLYVREAYHFDKEYNADPTRRALRASAVPPTANVYYAADGPKPYWAGRRRPSIHQPKWASRILLEVQEIQVERIQEIGVGDCLREGVAHLNDFGGGPRASFNRLWDSINDHRGYGWEANPWVWVVSFKVLQKERIRA